MYCNDCGADLDFQRCTCDDKYAHEREFWMGRAAKGSGSSAAGGGRKIGVKAPDELHVPVEATDTTAKGA